MLVVKYQEARNMFAFFLCLLCMLDFVGVTVLGCCVLDPALDTVVALCEWAELIRIEMENDRFTTLVHWTPDTFGFWQFFLLVRSGWLSRMLHLDGGMMEMTALQITGSLRQLLHVSLLTTR